MINKNGATWPAVGDYHEVYDIYYSLCDERETHNYPHERCVHMIEVSTTASAHTSKIEYLFDERDKLIIIHHKVGYNEAEARYYLSNERLVRYDLNNTVHDTRVESHSDRSAFESLRRRALRWAGFFKKR